MAGLALAQPALHTGVHLKGLKRDFAGTPVAPEAPLRRRTLGRSHLLVQFANNPSDDQVNDLQNLGATVLSYVPDFALSISVNDGVSFDSIGLLAVGRLRPVEKISPDLAGTLVDDVTVTVLAEFYQDVDPNDARAIAKDAGLLIQENPDLLSNHLLVSGTAKEVLALAGRDDVAYIFPAAPELIAGTPMHASAAAFTKRGAVAQSVALVGGWDGAVRGGADLKYAWVQLTAELPADSVQAENRARVLRVGKVREAHFHTHQRRGWRPNYSGSLCEPRPRRWIPVCSAGWHLGAHLLSVSSQPGTDRGQHALQRRRELENRGGCGRVQHCAA